MGLFIKKISLVKSFELKNYLISLIALSKFYYLFGLKRDLVTFWLEHAYAIPLGH